MEAWSCAADGDRVRHLCNNISDWVLIQSNVFGRDIMSSASIAVGVMTDTQHAQPSELPFASKARPKVTPPNFEFDEGSGFESTLNKNV